MPRLRPAPEKKEEITKVSSEPEVIIEAAEEEPEIEIVDPTDTQDDASVSLQKQIDDLRKSEEIQKGLAAQAMRDRDDAIRQSRENSAQLARAQKESQDFQVTSITSALAAAKAEADKAQLDIENAISLGDAKGQADAYRRLAVASANMARLEEGKEAIEARAKEAPIQTRQPQNDPLANSPLPPVAKDYLRLHPELLTDTRKNARLQGYHWDAIEAGHPEFTPEYFKYMDEKFHYGQQEQQQQVQTEQRRVPVSAPVSREVPNSDGKRPTGKVRLTAEEQEYARIAGVTVEEYAKQKLKRDEMRANGQYGDQR